MSSDRVRGAVLVAALFLASFGALVCEVSWGRLLALALGGTVAAATVVLMAFMAGLAAGSAVWGRWADRWQRPERLFGVCQLSSAAAAALSYPLIALVPGVAAAAGAPLGAALAIMTVGVGSFSIGGAYPSFAKAYVRDGQSIGRGLGLVNAVDALAGAAGGLAAGFVLLGTVGQARTLAIAVALNLAAGAIALVLPPRAAATPVRRPEPEARPGPGPGNPAMILAVAGLTGLSGMALQVVWIRTLKVFLPNTSYSFSLVAGVLILGLAAGSGIYRLLAGRIRRPLAWLAAVQLASGVYLCLSSLVLHRLPALVLFPLAGALETAGLRIFLPPAALALALALAPAIGSGFVFPLLCAAYAGALRLMGTGVGRVRLANAAGSVAGPALAAFLLIPLAGVVKSVQLTALVPLGVALWAAWDGRQGGGRALRALAIMAAAAGLALSAAAPRTMILPPSFSQSGGRQTQVIHYRETTEGTVTVSEDARTGIRACHVNNSAVVGTTYDAIKVVKLLGHLPYLLGCDARDVLVVGFGTGVTAATVASHPGVRRIDCVEIAPGVREAARFFTEYNRGVALSPVVNFIPADGRVFLARTAKTYDMISADPTHPTLGCASLYTVEYFRLCRERLRPGGSICQYLPLHGLTPRMLSGIVAGFRSVFPHATVWLGHSHCVLLGGAAALPVPFDSFAARVRGLDDPLFYKDPYSVASCLLLDEDGAAALAAPAPPCTDDRNYLEFFDPAAKDQANWERNIAMLTGGAADLRRVFPGADPAALGRFAAGRAAFIAGQIRQNRGDRVGAVAGFRGAVTANPENEEYRFLLEQEAGRAGEK